MSYAEDMRREAERRQARHDRGLPLNETPEELKARAREEDDRLEKDIQAECVKEYRGNGCVVYEGLKSKAKIQPGWPDLGVFHPATRQFWFHEVKTPTGRMRPDQEDFRRTCITTGVTHIVGGIAVAKLAIETLLHPPLHPPTTTRTE